MSTDPRIAHQHRRQDYDPNPPRCGTCVYFSRGTDRQRRLERRKGRGIDHLQRCTFGNFPTTPVGVCDEWHSARGERVEVAVRHD